MKAYSAVLALLLVTGCGLGGEAADSPQHRPSDVRAVLDGAVGRLVEAKTGAFSSAMSVDDGEIVTRGFYDQTVPFVEVTWGMESRVEKGSDGGLLRLKLYEDAIFGGPVEGPFSRCWFSYEGDESPLGELDLGAPTAVLVAKEARALNFIGGDETRVAAEVPSEFVLALIPTSAEIESGLEGLDIPAVIDIEKGLVRRLVLDLGGDSTTTITIEFWDLGRPVDSTPPDENMIATADDSPCIDPG